MDQNKPNQNPPLEILQEHPCYRSRTKTAQFSSPYMPPRQQSCSLPFGYIVTPLSIASKEDVSIVEEEPIVCISCLCYFNLYCEVMNQGSIWICPLCGCHNVIPMECYNLLSLCMSSSIVEYHSAISQKVNTTGYVIILDENLSHEEIKSIRDTFFAYITNELTTTPKQTILFGLLTFSSTISVYQVGLSGIACCNVYKPLTTNHLFEQYYNDVKECSFLGYNTDGSHNLYQCLTALSTTNTTHHTISRREFLLKKLHFKNKTPKKSDCRCTGSAIKYASAILQQPIQNSRFLLFTNGVPNLGIGSVTKPNTMTLDPIYQSSAIQYYNSIGKQLFASNQGMDVFCSGVSSILGIQSAFLTLVSASGGYVIPHGSLDCDGFRKDLDHVLRYTYLCHGSCELAAPEENVYDEEGGLLYENQVNELTFNGCLFDIRLPSFIQAIQTIGPGQEIKLQYDTQEQEYDATAPLLPFDIPSYTSNVTRALNLGLQQQQQLPNPLLLSTTLTRIQMGRYDPLSTFSSILQITTNEQIPKDALFQFIIRYISKDGCTYITRVHTYKLSTAHTIIEFVKSVDDEVMPVLLGREAVLRCFINKKGNANVDMEEVLSQNACNDLDYTIHRISTTYRKLEQQDEYSNTSSQDFAFPPELSTSLHLLHHLRRGPLLNISLYNLEDRASLRSLFLRLPLQDCLMIMGPNLWSIRLGQSSELIPIPPETLVLWDNVIIASDTFDSLYIWSGQATISSPDYTTLKAKLITHLQTLSNHRFPQPDKVMYDLYDGDSMSRYFTCRLVPTHCDPSEYQVAHFPDLMMLSTQDMMSLRGKFRFFGEGGDTKGSGTFRKWFWSVASVSSKIDGVSLCE